MKGIYRVCGVKDGELFELVGGPRDGQTWRLPAGAYEFTIAGEYDRDIFHRWSRKPDDPPGRMAYAGVTDGYPEDGEGA